MDVLILNTDFETIGVIDYYISLIWTERYAEAGDFELYLKSDSSVFDIVKQGYYLYLKGAKMTMIIEQLEINTDVEDGNELIITGRSLESILDRRIIWPQTNLDGYLQGQIHKLINECIIEPSDASRKIDNFIFKESTDPEVTSLKLEAQYTGDNLYDTICAICASYNLGFRVTLTTENKFEFELYSGVDRSYDQIDNTYVIFSSKYDNLISSNFLETDKSLKTVAVVAGEGEGTDRKNVTIASESGSGSGLGRRELFVDAKDISSTSETATMSDEAYKAKLMQRGHEKMADCVSVTTFEGEVENGQTFTFDEDYFIGDVVQLVDQYGREGTVRVTELVRSIGAEGIQFYPTFVITYKATIKIKGNANDTIKITGTGYGYSLTLDETGEASIVVKATGDYIFTATNSGVEYQLSVSTYTTSYTVDLSFSTTVNLTLNPNTAVVLINETDAEKKYEGTSDTNGSIKFNLTRYGAYYVVTQYYSEVASDDAPKLSTIPESSELIGAYLNKEELDAKCVYVGNIGYVSCGDVDYSNPSGNINVTWSKPGQLFEGVALYKSESEYPESPDSETYTLVQEGPGSDLGDGYYGCNISGLESGKVYYFSAWPYYSFNGQRYYGEMSTTYYSY